MILNQGQEIIKEEKRTSSVLENCNRFQEKNQPGPKSEFQYLNITVPNKYIEFNSELNFLLFFFPQLEIWYISKRENYFGFKGPLPLIGRLKDIAVDVERHLILSSIKTDVFPVIPFIVFRLNPASVSNVLIQ